MGHILSPGCLGHFKSIMFPRNGSFYYTYLASNFLKNSVVPSNSRDMDSRLVGLWNVCQNHSFSFVSVHAARRRTYNHTDHFLKVHTQRIFAITASADSAQATSYIKQVYMGEFNLYRSFFSTSEEKF